MQKVEGSSPFSRFFFGSTIAFVGPSACLRDKAGMDGEGEILGRSANRRVGRSVSAS
jgi:hypothetical protein